MGSRLLSPFLFPPVSLFDAAPLKVDLPRPAALSFPPSTRKQLGLLVSALLTGLVVTGGPLHGPFVRSGYGASASSPSPAAGPRAPPVDGLLRPLGDAGASRNWRLRQRHPLAPQGGCERERAEAGRARALDKIGFLKNK